MATIEAKAFSNGFCRDCLTMVRPVSDGKQPPRRCYACGSPRLLKHDELTALSIGHIDCDAFYAAVEKRDNPALADQPVIIGGGKRGVVSTACYLARIKGVKSAMPMFKALALCPEAVVVKPNMSKYSSVGREIREAMLQLTPSVEPISIDEAFLDMSGTTQLHKAPPAYSLARLASQIERDIGITVSVGLSYCKYLAKIASDLDKPRGFSIIGEAEALAFLAKLPVRKIWGVGAAFEKTLSRDGITTIGQLQKMDQGDLMKRYGAMGNRLFYLSRGQDERRVKTRERAKSVSGETTFNDDKRSLAELVPPLRALSEEVSRRLKKSDLAGRSITLKLKSADFKLRTRSLHLPDATQLADRIFDSAHRLLKNEIDGTAFRLIGVGVADIENDERADPPDLVDLKATRRAQAERAIDTLRDKWGDRVVETGYTFGLGKRGRIPNSDDE